MGIHQLSRKPLFVHTTDRALLLANFTGGCTKKSTSPVFTDFQDAYHTIFPFSEDPYRFPHY